MDPCQLHLLCVTAPIQVEKRTRTHTHIYTYSEDLLCQREEEKEREKRGRKGEKKFPIQGANLRDGGGGRVSCLCSAESVLLVFIESRNMHRASNAALRLINGREREREGRGGVMRDGPCLTLTEGFPSSPSLPLSQTPFHPSRISRDSQRPK